MSLNRWLRNPRSALSPSARRHKHARRRSLRAATHRLHLETLEDRRPLALVAPVDYPVDAGPHAVVTADFNNDGHLDLATANSDATCSVLLGDGQGGFGAASRFAGASPSSSTSATSMAMANSTW